MYSVLQDILASKFRLFLPEEHFTSFSTRMKNLAKRKHRRLLRKEWTLLVNITKFLAEKHTDAVFAFVLHLTWTEIEKMSRFLTDGPYCSQCINGG